MLAVRVAAVEPAHVPPLDKVSETIRAKLLDERSAEAARQAGEAALAADKANPAASPEGFAGAVTVSRQDPGGLPRAVLDAIMRQPAARCPPTWACRRAPTTVARLEKVEPGKVEQAERESLASQLSGAYGQAENEAVVRMLREQYKVQVLPASADAIRASSPPRRADPWLSSGRSAGHVIEQLGLGILVGMDAVSLEHGPVRRNAFHQEGTSRAFRRHRGEQLREALRVVAPVVGRDLHAHDDHVGVGLARGLGHVAQVLLGHGQGQAAQRRSSPAPAPPRPARAGAARRQAGDAAAGGVAADAGVDYLVLGVLLRNPLGQQRRSRCRA